MSEDKTDRIIGVVIALCMTAIVTIALLSACSTGDAENAKLRELCKMFAEYVSQDRCEGCVVKRRCNEGDIEECWQRAEIRKAASELRIEVD